MAQDEPPQNSIRSATQPAVGRCATASCRALRHIPLDGHSQVGTPFAESLGIRQRRAL